MASGFALRQAQSAASMEATRLHRQLGTTFDGPVDVLGIARDLGLVLMVQPLDNLLGFYVRGDELSGIVINSEVPESLQRFTLAHEIGHHVLGHEGTADDEHAMDRFDPNSVSEVAAQAFAASLLMPLPLVNRTLRDLPATRLSRRIEPADAYLFSRQLGVSFSAGVWALYRQNLLPLKAARAYIKRGALAAKDDIRGVDRVSDARADVWTLNAENNDLNVMCRVGDEIHVLLPEDTSRGLAWILRTPSAGGLFEPGDAVRIAWTEDDLRLETSPAAVERQSPTDARQQTVELVVDEHFGSGLDPDPVADARSQLELFSTPAEPEFGAATTGFRSLTFVPRGEGDNSVVLELARPWDLNGPALSRYELDLHVRPKRLDGRGLLAPAADAWVDDHVASA